MWCDVPRYFELFRNGLVESACVYTSMTGFSYFYLGLGNDIGYDSANGYPNSIPCDQTPHYGSGPGFVNTITGARKLPVTYIMGSGWWTGFPWLGELYPDSMASEFLGTSGGSVRGNLPAGSFPGQAFQYSAQTAYGVTPRLAYATSIEDHHQRTQENGCSTFFNIGTSTSRFRHVYVWGTSNGTLTTTGEEVAGLQHDHAGDGAREPAVRAGLQRQRRSTGTTRRIRRATRARSTRATTLTHRASARAWSAEQPDRDKAGYIIVNGIDRTVESGTRSSRRVGALACPSFLEAGDINNTLRIQTPRVEIESPTDITELQQPTEIDVWSGSIGRAGTGSRTRTGTPGEDEGELEYVLIYSSDNGVSYRYLLDGALATPGQRPSNALYRESDVTAGDESFTWSAPAADFPQGSYLRVDCFRQGAQVHYAWHQTRSTSNDDDVGVAGSRPRVGLQPDRAGDLVRSVGDDDPRGVDVVNYGTQAQESPPLTRVTEITQEILDDMRLELVSSVRLFSDDAEGSGNLARFDLGDAPTPLSASRLPTVSATETIRTDTVGEEITGNSLFFTRLAWSDRRLHER